MFKSKEKKETPSLTSTVIGNGIRIKGAVISGAGSIRIDGNVISDINVDGDITVGDTGYIQGNVNVANALFAGRIDGNVVAESSVHLTASSHIIGNISAMSLVIDEGAVFSGTCNMTTKNQTPTTVFIEDKDILVTDTNKNQEIELNQDPNLTYDKA